jgi:SAM-dependent methyltransferase
MDISPTAIALAQDRCRSLSNVNVQQGALPDQLPDGEFDLIVFSEIGYYFEPKILLAVAQELVSRMSSDGIFLAAHWLGTSPDHLLNGDQVHELLDSMNLRRLRSERFEGFRLDCWRRT